MGSAAQSPSGLFASQNTSSIVPKFASAAPQFSSSSGQETSLPHAFSTMTLQDPSNGGWNMDTGATSHLNSSTNCLRTIFA